MRRAQRLVRWARWGGVGEAVWCIPDTKGVKDEPALLIHALDDHGHGAVLAAERLPAPPHRDERDDRHHEDVRADAKGREEVKQALGERVEVQGMEVDRHLEKGHGKSGEQSRLRRHRREVRVEQIQLLLTQLRTRGTRAQREGVVSATACSGERERAGRRAVPPSRRTSRRLHTPRSCAASPSSAAAACPPQAWSRGGAEREEAATGVPVGGGVSDESVAMFGVALGGREAGAAALIR